MVKTGQGQLVKGTAHVKKGGNARGAPDNAGARKGGPPGVKRELGKCWGRQPHGSRDENLLTEQKNGAVRGGLVGEGTQGRSKTR